MEALARQPPGAAAAADRGVPAGAPALGTDGETEHVVVVVDGYRPGEGPPSLEALLGAAAAVSVTVVVLVPSHARFPRSAAPGSTGQTRPPSGTSSPARTAGWRPGWSPTGWTRRTRRSWPGRWPRSRLRSGEAGADLADPVRLVELLGADEAGQLDLRSAWMRLDSLADGLPPGFLALPIGRKDDGTPLLLDLKEAAAGGMGPHGMLVGATGSGKSELLRSLTAAVAARHDPTLVNLLLIDFKGGAAFADLAALPHVAGLVTNLADDLSLVDRMQLALAGEMARRQEALRLAGNLASIADYQAARARGMPLEPLPYLVVVVDEFGELLVAKPEFLDTFLTVARLGRSLGVHLLLATQRLDEGRIRGLEPHLRYRICLRTFTATESRAVLELGRRVRAAVDARARLPRGGQRPGAVQGRDVRAWCSSPGDLAGAGEFGGGPARPLSALLRPLSLSGPVPADGRARAGQPRTNDLQVLVKLAGEAGPGRARQVWVEPLPAALTLGASAQLRRTAPASWPARGRGRPGRPARAAGPAGGPLPTRPGPAATSGSPGRPGRASRRSSRRWCSPWPPSAGPTGASSTAWTWAAAGCSSWPRCRTSGRSSAAARTRPRRGCSASCARCSTSGPACAGPGRTNRAWPEVFLVVDNVGQLRQSAPDLEFDLTELATAGLPFGLHVLLSANRWLDIRPQLLDALGTRWEFHLADPAESLSGRAAAARVAADLPGRGLTRDGHLFQAALPALSAEPAPGDLAEAVSALASRAGARPRAGHRPAAAPGQPRRRDRPGAGGRLAAARAGGRLPARRQRVPQPAGAAST